MRKTGFYIAMVLAVSLSMIEPALAREIDSSLRTLSNWMLGITVPFGVVVLLLNVWYSKIQPEGSSRRLAACVAVIVFGFMSPSIVETLADLFHIGQ